MADAIRVDGLAQFSRNLRKLNADLPKALRIALNDAANVVVDYARPRVPRRTGRAQSTIKARSTRTAVRVVAGGRRAPYFPWLDFGGRVGRRKSVRRAFYAEGRYLWVGLRVKRPEFEAALTKALLDAARSAGVEVE